jgi:hypothetical protein
MGEEQKEEIQPITRHNKTALISLGIATILMLIGAGSTLISTGELKQAVVNTKEADKNMLDQLRVTTAEVTSLKMGQERRDIVDSLFRVESRKDRTDIRNDIKNVQIRLSRLEFQRNMKPFEPSQLFDEKKYSPFDVSQLTLQDYRYSD